jgi:hypothetical protein
MRRAFLHSVILEARALHDRDGGSLGSCQIAKGLGDPVAREGLRKYLAEYPHGRVMQDVEQRDRYLDYLQRYCSVMAPPKSAKLPDHPLAAKAQLVRRMANKAVAHSTLDDYTLGGEDLADVVIASVVIACAIEAAVGDAAIQNDFAAIELSGYRAAGHLLHVEVDQSSYNVNMVRGFLPVWVQSGIEFPRSPGDFQHRRTKQNEFPY